jgi:hypothetical protein
MLEKFDKSPPSFKLPNLKPHCPSEAGDYRKKLALKIKSTLLLEDDLV